MTSPLLRRMPEEGEGSRGRLWLCTAIPQAHKGLRAKLHHIVLGGKRTHCEEAGAETWKSWAQSSYAVR